MTTNDNNNQLDWAPPVFRTQFQGVKTKQGNDAQFTANVFGLPAPDVMWTLNNQKLPNSDKYQQFYDPNSGDVTLIIRQMGPGDEGDYSCRVWNGYGNIIATLTIDPDSESRSRRCLSPFCRRTALLNQ